MTPNFEALEELEQRFRKQTVEYIGNNAELAELMQFVENGMVTMVRYTLDHPHTTDDEKTVQYLGIRMFNAAASSIKLGYAGYYQNAFLMVRDILEVGFLFDYFRSYPAKVGVWKGAKNSQLKREFGPGAIRDALDKRDGSKEKKRQKSYQILCERAAHATYVGFGLTRRDGYGEFGPFFDERKLEAWLQELVFRFCPSAVVYASLLPSANDELKKMMSEYSAGLVGWHQTLEKRLSSPP